MAQEHSVFALSLACNLALCGLVFTSRCQHPNCMSKCSFNYNLGYKLLNHCPVELEFYFPGLSPHTIFFFFFLIGNWWEVSSAMSELCKRMAMGEEKGERNGLETAGTWGVTRLCPAVMGLPPSCSERSGCKITGNGLCSWTS